MTNSEIKTTDFLIPADLWPGTAPAMHRQLLKWLSQQGSKATVELGSEGDQPTVSALQLLIATTRRTSGPPPAFGNTALAAIAEHIKPQIMKRDTE